MASLANQKAMINAIANTQGTKYNIYSNRWTNIALNKGIYEVTAQDVGQVIYIADNPLGQGALRITKNFQIETSGRTTLYVKGQNELDVKITKLEADLIGKADKSDTYTMAQVDKLITDNLGIIGKGGVHFKDILADEAEIQTKAGDAQLGDLYMAKDTGMFYIFTEEGFKAITTNILSLDDYYTKAEVDVYLQGKADEAEFVKLKAQVDALVDLGGGFTYIQEQEPTATDATEGQTWLNPTKPMIYTLKKDAQGDNFWYPISDEMKIELTPLFVGKTGDETIEGLKTFSSVPKSAKSPIEREDLANKGYVDDKVGSLATDMFVTLNGDQTIQGTKTFGVTPKLQSNVLDNADMVNKAYVDNAITQAQVGGGGQVDLTNYMTTNTPQTIAVRKSYTENQTLTAIPAANTDIVNKQYVDEAVADVSVDVDTSNLVTLDGEQTITGAKNFTSTPTAEKQPATNYELANKDYVDTQTKSVSDEVDKIKDGTTELTGYAMLAKDNTFTGANTFDKAVTLNTEATADTDAVSKKYVDDKLKDVGIDDSNFAKLDTENTFTQNNTFDLNVILNTEPTEDTHATSKSYVDGKITELSGKIDQITSGGADLTGYGKLEGENEWQGKNTFGAEVIVNSLPQTDYEVANKKYVDDNIKDFAKLADNNAFAGENYFNQNVKLNITQDKITDDKDVPNLEYLKAHYVDLTTAQTIEEEKTFRKLPIAEGWDTDNAVGLDLTPTREKQLTPKKYVDEELVKLKESLGSFMEFKGAVTDGTALEEKKADAKNGDVYFNQEDSSFYIYDGTSFVIIGGSSVDFADAVVYRGDVANNEELQTKKDGTEKTGDLWYVTEETAFYIYKESEFVVLGGGKTGGGDIDSTDLVTLNTEQTITEQKTFDKIPKITDPDTTLPTEKSDLITMRSLEEKEIYSITSRLAVKSDGSVVWEESDFMNEQNKDPNKLYVVESALFEEFPVIKSDADSFVWTYDEYKTKAEASELKTGFYFIEEEKPLQATDYYTKAEIDNLLTHYASLEKNNIYNEQSTNTFKTAIIQAKEPTQDNELTTKKYVDDAIAKVGQGG